MAQGFRERGWPEWHIDDFFKIHGEAASPTVTSAVQDVTGAEPAGFTSFLASLRLAATAEEPQAVTTAGILRRGPARRRPPASGR